MAMPMRGALAGLFPAAAAAALLATTPATAQNTSPRSTSPPASDVDALKRQLDELARRNQEMQRQMDELRQRLDALQKQPAATPSPTPPAAGQPAPIAPPAESPQEALDRALQGLPAQPAQPPAPAKPGTPSAAGPGPSTATSPTSDLYRLKVGQATLRLIDLSLVIDVAAGWSTANDAMLHTLEGGDHDPRKRGFTLQAGELSVAGAVDPYFSAQAHINYNIDPSTGESNVELEEAYATSQSLPYGLEFKAGHYLTEFGVINPTHAHAWDWMDQPIIATRLFGGDGMRAPGARLAWLTPLPWYSQVFAGVQDANGGTMPSFLANAGTFDERAIGGRPFTERGVSSLGDLVYTARWENSVDLSKSTTAKFGVSGAFGPNATGSHGSTRIYGADLKLKWRPGGGQRGWPFVLWQSEIMARDYQADPFFSNADPANVIDLPGATLHDWGFYTQSLYGFTTGWAAGMRYEYAGGSGASVGSFDSRDDDPFRDNRHRFSPLLVWQMSEFSRLRLQYNYDLAEHLKNGHAHSVWFGLEVLFGAHPAHTY
jgi:hypothetical protein